MFGVEFKTALKNFLVIVGEKTVGVRKSNTIVNGLEIKYVRPERKKSKLPKYVACMNVQIILTTPFGFCSLKLYKISVKNLKLDKTSFFSVP